MESIKKLLQDPTWWVTAVFVGLIVSVIAGFLKDAISQTLANSSSTIRAWQQRRRVEFTQEAELLSRDFGFILYTRIKSVGLIVIWSTMLMIMMAAYILLNLLEAHHVKATAILIASGVFSFFPYYHAIHFARLSFKAKTLYETKHFPNDTPME